MELIQFDHSHIAKLEPNRYSKSATGALALDNPQCKKRTLIDEHGEPLAVIVYRETAPQEFGAFFIVSKRFNLSHCLTLRSFVQLLVAEENATHVWTASRQEPELEHWHKFLGLHKDGQLDVQGETYDVWRAIWD